ncbi:MAG TPA: hypothetical protein VH583_24450 [Vicinamibacterales bacterium]
MPYQTIYTDTGVLMVSLENLSQYANGYKARFAFGNPQSIDFDNVEIKLRWGPARPKKFQPGEQQLWRAKFQTATQKIGKRIHASSWNPTDIILSPATSEQVGVIEIESISAPTVFMRQQ